MGLNYYYLLYFKRDQIWNVLQGLVEISDTDGVKPTTIQFPDHELVLPIMSSWRGKEVIPYNQPEIEFSLVLKFSEDEAILDYVHYRDGDPIDRSPPEEGQDNIYSIGFIYLTVYVDLSQHYGFKQPNDMVLFKFGTTGTHMSFLFADSTSIRKTFVNLLERYKGVIGIFDWENDYGELFWFKGKQMQFSLSSNFLLPGDIEEELERGW